jgi:ATP-binding cassette subfamily C protein LapB
MNLLPCLARLAQLQHESVDRLALQAAAQAATAVATITAPPSDAKSGRDQLKTVARHLQVRPARWLSALDAAALPALLWHAGQWGLLRGRNAQGQWVSEWWETADQRWREQSTPDLAGHAIARLSLRPPYVASDSAVYQLIRHEVLAQRRLLREAVVGGLLLNIIALAASFYSMQVYDRVIPSGATQTLLVLTLGVVAAVLFELVAKRVRSGLYERLIDQVDQRLARAVYQRFLAVRLDQMPQSVGSLAAQMRGYETARGFFTSVTTNLLVDAPFALLFLAVIASISVPLALVPLGFLVLSLVTGLYSRRAVTALAQRAIAASNQKAGLLVETVEGAETLKSGQGGWRMLSRWMKTTDEARDSELQSRNISDHAQHLISAFQQLSYVLLVAAGALLVSRSELTMGALIACSILAGRVLGPVAMIPSQMALWAHTQAALQGLDRLWALQDDHHGQDEPVVVAQLRGDYRFDAVAAQYGANKALSVPKLQIAAGEKVGVLGPVGAGKTTLLRLMSGLYKPQQGRILLDDIDLAHIAKPTLADHLGYVQQDGRLFAGTLRDNLILGQIDPGDDAILDAARRTGLMQTVISAHSKGLQQEIFEGGSGLSGGQRQLVNLTRTFLRRPSVWLLDEPTASMDRSLELQVTRALQAALKPQDTLVLVTHKAEMLLLVDRVIVIAGHQIVMDGPKAQVLQQLNAPAMEKAA